MRSTNLGWCCLVLCFILVSHVAASSSAAVRQLTYFPSKSECRGSLAECLAGDGDFELEVDSESSRRTLVWTRYISYGALSRNSIPCSRRGASYYNCRPGAEANPYRRGCSAITRCRS